jgi:hypothetical protein
MSDMKIASDWTAEDSSTRCDLPRGQWVEFRDEVSYGDQAELDVAWMPMSRLWTLLKAFQTHTEAVKARYDDPLSKDDSTSASPSAA